MRASFQTPGVANRGPEAAPDCLANHRPLSGCRLPVPYGVGVSWMSMPHSSRA
jgi:hypothetical protein